MELPEHIRLAICHPPLMGPIPSQCKLAANRAFRYLHAHASFLPQSKQVEMWEQLVKAVQSVRPEWVCEGPTVTTKGHYAYQGPKGYTIVFSELGLIYLCMLKSMPDSDWRPSFEKMMTLSNFISMIGS